MKKIFKLGVVLSALVMFSSFNLPSSDAAKKASDTVVNSSVLEALSTQTTELGGKIMLLQDLIQKQNWDELHTEVATIQEGFSGFMDDVKSSLPEERFQQAKSIMDLIDSKLSTFLNYSSPDDIKKALQTYNLVYSKWNDLVALLPLG